MALKSAGLQTHIWNNNFRSLVVLAIYPFIILAVAWTCMFTVNSIFSGVDYSALHNGQYFGSVGDAGIAKTNRMMAEFWPSIIVVLSCWFLIAYFSHHQMIMKMSGARSLSRKEEPELNRQVAVSKLTALCSYYQ